MQITFDLNRHPAARKSLERYMNLQEAPCGSLHWISRHYRAAWNKGTFKIRPPVEIARTALKRHKTKTGEVRAREVFSVARVRLDPDTFYEHKLLKYQYVLLWSLVGRTGKLCAPTKLIGEYSLDDDFETLLAILPKFRKRGLGPLLLLAAQKGARDTTSSGWYTRAGYHNRKSAHRMAVKAALKAGEKLPPQVLREYQDRAGRVRI